MKYLIVQDWSSTHGNHAGMVHMCNLLKKNHPNEYEVIIKPCPKAFKKYTNKFCKLIQYLYRKYYSCVTYYKEYKKLCKPIFEKISETDSIFLLEYCDPDVPQKKLAFYLRKKYPNIKIYALSHLAPTHFKNKHIYPMMLNKWSLPIDKMLTLGSSLSKYFIENDIPEYKISTGFHYVDSNYYHKNHEISLPKNRLKVIMMGGMQRDYSMLAEICSETPFIDWIICKGRMPIDGSFKGICNVELKGFLSEDELKHQMDQADISLNIMEDTVGSNVITTSLSMGLAMICSDVGSIRDYCNNSNTIFCYNNTKSFVDALKILNADRARVLSMRKESLYLAKSLNIEKVNEWFLSVDKR